MNTELITSLVFYVILYTSLVCAVLPLMFFLLWSFTGFFKKHIVVFYLLTAGLFVGATVLFYLTQKFWILWYYPFPAWAQIAGLLIWLVGIAVIKISEMSIGRMVRMFYPLLKGEKYHLKTTGIYGLVRHPIYTAFPLIILGALLYTGQLILLVPLIFNLLTRTWYASKEESYTQQVVIGDYEAYKKKTPNRFYPKLF
jgi:protein-S-isoprenylcysteine O-methyltransferase Ste14